MTPASKRKDFRRVPRHLELPMVERMLFPFVRAPSVGMRKPAFALYEPHEALSRSAELS